MPCDLCRDQRLETTFAKKENRGAPLKRAAPARSLRGVSPPAPRRRDVLCRRRHDGDTRRRPFGGHLVLCVLAEGFRARALLTVRVEVDLLPAPRAPIVSRCWRALHPSPRGRALGWLARWPPAAPQQPPPPQVGRGGRAPPPPSRPHCSKKSTCVALHEPAGVGLG